MIGDTPTTNASIDSTFIAQTPKIQTPETQISSPFSDLINAEAEKLEPSGIREILIESETGRTNIDPAYTEAPPVNPDRPSEANDDGSDRINIDPEYTNPS